MCLFSDEARQSSHQQTGIYVSSRAGLLIIQVNSFVSSTVQSMFRFVNELLFISTSP